MNIEKKNVKDLLPADYNPRKDLKPGDPEYEKLKRSIEQFGYVEPVIWNKATGRVVGGHQRLKVLIDMGISEVECVVVELDEEKEKALNIALNKISGDWDKDKLALLIADLQGADFDVSLTGFEPAEIDALFKDTLKDGVKEDDFDVDSELQKPIITKPGDVWMLGRHRLVCGDATSAETYETLMGNTKANLIVTDPPYNVNYEGSAGKIINDNLILLTSDHNRSYQDMPYDQKVVQYMGDNILAQSLNAGAYQNNPKFLALSNEYGFKAYAQFDKTAIRERLQLYTSLAKSIWNPAVIKELAGGWDDAMEITIQSGNARRFTVEYGSGRSWVDARKYGFVSAYGDGGTLLNNINVGDFIFCHIAGVGFVGIGTCTSRETPASSFSVNDNGIIKNILDCDWVDQTARATIDPANEYFIGIKWIYTVSADDGYWEKGMTSLPMVAYMMNDETTHNKVLKHFNITLT